MKRDEILNGIKSFAKSNSILDALNEDNGILNSLEEQSYYRYSNVDWWLRK